MSDASPLPPQEAATAIQLHINVAQNRQLVFSSAVGREDSRKAHSDVVDKWLAVADRLELVYELRKLRAELKQMTREYEHMQEDRARIDAKLQSDWEAANRRGPFKLEGKNKVDRDNADVTRKRYEDEMGFRTKQIENLEGQLAALDAELATPAKET